MPNTIGCVPLLALYFSSCFGLPRGRSEISRPRIPAVLVCEWVSPSRVSRARLCLRALSSASVSTELTFHRVDVASPLSGLQDRAVAKQSVLPTSSCRLQAGPLPVLTALDHVRSQRIPLHVTQHREIVLIGLNGKRFESSLSDVAAAFVVPMVTTNMRRHEPLHPATEVSIFMRPQQQVEMDCHQTKPVSRIGTFS